MLAKSIQRLLLVEEKETQLTICIDRLQQAEVNESFMKIVIMGDRIFVYRYNVKMKQPFSQWKAKFFSGLEEP
jgi:hypothetical protein